MEKLPKWRFFKRQNVSQLPAVHTDRITKSVDLKKKPRDVFEEAARLAIENLTVVTVNTGHDGVSVIEEQGYEKVEE